MGLLAMRVVEPDRIEATEVGMPKPGPGEALLKVKLVGICGSDVHMFHGTHPFLKPPVVPGHEGCGVVEEVGAGVTRVRPGDRVAVDPTLSCGECYPCRIGRYNCCVNIRVLGCYVDGLFAEYIALPEENLYRLPDSLTDEQGALAEPLTIGAQANTRGRVADGDTVAIIGAGPIGLACLAVARHRGARVMVIEPKPRNREVALSMGAERAVDPKQQDMIEASQEWTNGVGPTVVMEAVGSAETFEAAVEMVAAAGRVVILGLAPGKVSFRGGLMIRKEPDILGSRLACDQFPTVISLMEEGKVNPLPLVTHRWKLSQAQEALETQTRPEAQVIKALIEVAAE